MSTFTTTTDQSQAYGSSATYLTARNAASADAGTMNNVGVVGLADVDLQGGLYYVERGYLPFDTSSLGSGATVLTAKLRLWFSTITDSDSTRIEIVNGTWPLPPADADWDLFTRTSFGNQALSGITTGQYTDITLNAGGIAAVNVTGTTKFTTISGLDYDGNPSTNRNVVQYQSVNAANPPLLVVTYSSAGSPTITVCIPASGYNYGSVSITDLQGTALTGAAPAVKLTKAAQSDINWTGVVQASPTSVTGVAPISAATIGLWNVVYTDGNGSSTITNGFTVLDGTPNPSSITPSTAASGTTVSITNLAGTNLTGTTSVKLKRTGSSDISMGSLTVVSDTKITGTFSLAGAVAGLWDVEITNPAATVTMTSAFTVTAVVLVATTNTDVVFNRQTVERQIPLAGITANVLSMKVYNNTKGQAWGVHELAALVRPTGLWR